MLPYLKFIFLFPSKLWSWGKLLHILQNMSVISSVQTSCVSEVGPP